MKKYILLMLALGFLGCYNAAYSVEDIYSLDDVVQPKVEVKDVDVSSMVKPLEANVVFDWLDLSVAQREENISKYANLLFENNSSDIFFTKDEFKNKFKDYFKDKNFKHHYLMTNNGVTEDEEAKYCAFYYKKDTLVMYAIQYKNNPQNAFYYSAFGKLFYTDVISNEYPNFPYTSMQYNRKGQLKSAIYFVSKDIQYMFNQDKEFQGIWYKDKMYDKNGKQILTRTNW